MISDIRIALRGWRRNPMFCLGAVSILALGIGLSTAAFEAFNVVLLTPLSGRDQERLVVLAGDLRGSRLPAFPLHRRSIRRFASSSKTLSDVAGVAYDGPWDWHVRDATDGHQSILFHSSAVTGNFFSVLGAKAELGRTLEPRDDALGAEKVIVLSHELWQRQYGGDPDVLGRRVVDQQSGAAYKVVGVMPAGFVLEQGADNWRALDAIFPIRADSDLDSPFALMRIVGRLAPGATPGAARAELSSFLRRDWQDRNPSVAAKLSASVHSVTDEVVGDVRPGLRVLGIVVCLLLLVACVNVANLLLVRGATRQPEFAVRASLGANRGRLVRLLLVEGILLVVCAMLVGVAIASLAISALAASASQYVPRLADARPSATTLVAAALIAGVTVALSVVGPALSASSGDLFLLMRSGAPSVTRSRRSRAARHALVIVQFALALTAVVTGGLLVRSLERLQHLNLGFNADRLAVVEVELTGPDRPTVSTTASMDQLRARVAALPGVTDVAEAIQTPLSTVGIDSFLTAEGEPESKLGTDPTVTLEFVSSEFFQTVGMPIVRGRSFNASDASGSALVVIVSESVARHYWPGQDPIGKRLRCTGDQQLCTVIGVVGDSRYRDLVRAHPMAFQPSRQAPAPVFAPRVLLVRTTGDPSPIIASVRSAIVGAEPSVAIGRATPVADLLEVPLARPRLIALLVSVFAIAALAMAVVGIFAVLTFHVTQRTRELGIRQALGATPGQIRQLVFSEGLLLSSVGLLCGVAISLAGAKSVQALLFDVSPADPISILGAIVLLTGCGVAAMALAAVRATRIDPMIALRSE
jgi:predicted permease